MAGGLALAFAVAGTVLTFLLVSTGLDPELFRYFAAGVLVLTGVLLLVERLGSRASMALSRLTAGFDPGARIRGDSAPAQFAIGVLLGVVWLPCVGPTLGAALALAAFGEDLLRSFAVMLSYGVGTGGVLLGAGLVSSRLLGSRRSSRKTGGRMARKILGWSVLLLGVLVLTGVDKMLEALAVDLLPSWIFQL
jgi:cytochrome c biogenesis protein CcdA